MTHPNVARRSLIPTRAGEFRDRRPSRRDCNRLLTVCQSQSRSTCPKPSPLIPPPLTQLKLMFDSIRGEAAAERQDAERWHACMWGMRGEGAAMARTARTARTATANHLICADRQQNPPKVATSPCRFLPLLPPITQNVKLLD